jgi:hypothetical protein
LFDGLVGLDGGGAVLAADPTPLWSTAEIEALQLAGPWSRRKNERRFLLGLLHAPARLGIPQ